MKSKILWAKSLGTKTLSGFVRGDTMVSYPLVNVYIGNWKDPPFFMGKSTISRVTFNSYVKLPEGRYG